MRNLLLLLVAGAVCGLAVESGAMLRVGTGDRRGPLSIGLNNFPAGHAFVYAGAQPDLFVVAGAHSADPGLFLFKWKATAADGTPVFGEPVKVGYPGAGPKLFPECTVYVDGKVVRGLFLQKKELIHAVFNAAKKEFVEESRIALDSLPKAPGAVAVVPGAKGVTLLFLVRDDTPGFPPGPASKDRNNSYVPYDGAGIWRGGLPYLGLYQADLSGARPVLSPRQVLLHTNRLTVVNLGPGHQRDLIAGSRIGDTYFYRNRSETGVELEERRHAVGEDGIVLRHPIIGNSPVAYPNAKTGLSDLLSGGEGAVYWYRFTGRFDGEGRPVYAAPKPTLEQDAALYAGTLPVPTIVDWNGDGLLDLVVGNSEGRILFFRNRGTNDQPLFDVGVALSAGGREIHVEPGYKGDIQGPGEARWGYNSTNVTDWTGDGLPDILMGDSLARHTVFVNRGTKREPRLEPERPLYLDAMDLHGTWRVRPGVARMGKRMAYVALDDEDQFHLYWKIDTYNVADGGKLKMEDGTLITANFLGAGGTGRSKIELVDWDEDGKVDMVVGTPKHHSIPNPQTGLPKVLGLPGATVMFLKNVGTNEEPRFRFPVIFRHKGKNLYIGHHEIGASAGRLGGGGVNLVVSSEDGRLFLFQRRELEWSPVQ